MDVPRKVATVLSQTTLDSNPTYSKYEIGIITTWPQRPIDHEDHKNCRKRSKVSDAFCENDWKSVLRFEYKALFPAAVGSDLYSAGVCVESQPGDRISWEFTWIYSISPSKPWDKTPPRPRYLSSKRFQIIIHKSSKHSKPYSLKYLQSHFIITISLK